MLNRRQLLCSASGGFGLLPFWLTALDDAVGADGADALAPRPPHHEARAKSVIYLYMEGGPSQIDTFDPKPELIKHHGGELPLEESPNTVFNIGHTVMKSPYEFQQHGACGAWVSDLFPHVAEMVDDLCIIRSMHHGISNHSSACYVSHTGFPMSGKPSMGSWLTYGLGCETRELPGFVVLDCGQGPSGGAPSWGSGFLPAAFQGTLFSKNESPIDNLAPRETNDRQQTKLQALQRLNELSHRRFGGDTRIDARLIAYERAFRMQTAVPDLMDISDEPDETLRLYATDSKNPQTALFGKRCLLARRLVERGVRFVELFPPRVKADRWDQHGNLAEGHRLNAAAVDAPIAGLLQDLKRRGLLNQTVVLWGGEFGRTPNAQGTDGRDHNPFGYTVWTAGGGFRPGIQFGSTDDFGYYAVDDRVHLHDLHATILHLMGIDHERLTFRFSGRDYRLTDVHGRVVPELLA
ncbi:MAG: DUF1501 domain-containing protein [Pirellulaceae bacterium]|jgi:hypothetical protein|nr:DUF1501 domain-containing protein [Pirellulaceae bacterium]MDP7017371.1 DUF1501 domain-containing protein [Pirellulaceae bacterium]